jgi:hypothetical protein
VLQTGGQEGYYQEQSQTSYSPSGEWGRVYERNILGQYCLIKVNSHV